MNLLKNFFTDWLKMKTLAIAKVGFKECLGYRVVYFVFIMALLFILLGKSCTPGKITGNDMFFDASARHVLSVKVAFNGIVFWSMMLCGLIAANVLSRELEEDQELPEILPEDLYQVLVSAVHSHISQ